MPPLTSFAVLFNFRNFSKVTSGICPGRFLFRVFTIGFSIVHLLFYSPVVFEFHCLSETMCGLCSHLIMHCLVGRGFRGLGHRFLRGVFFIYFGMGQVHVWYYCWWDVLDFKSRSFNSWHLQISQGRVSKPMPRVHLFSFC